MSTARVNFFQGQFLRPQDLTDEQSYHLQQRRRHDARMHIWGIVDGLEIVKDSSGSLQLLPGKASDGFGRELILLESLFLDPAAFSRLASETLDYWLFYDRRPVMSAARGACETGVSTRWDETPRVQAFAPGGTFDAAKPPSLPEPFASGSGPFEPVDDPAVPWGVFLGRVSRDLSKEDAERYQVDLSQRRYAGVYAGTIEHPTGVGRIVLGANNGDGSFAVELARSATPEPPLTRVIEADATAVKIHAPVTVEGGVTVRDGTVEFLPGDSTCPPSDLAIYRANPSDGGSLRIHLGAGADFTPLEIGFTDDAGKFTACFAIKPDGLGGAVVEVQGDVHIKGNFDAARIGKLLLSEDARNALRAPFLAS